MYEKFQMNWHTYRLQKH